MVLGRTSSARSRRTAAYGYLFIADCAATGKHRAGKAEKQPSGTTDGIALFIDANLSTEQAVAVVELIDDLREQIVRHYAPQIQDHYRRTDAEQDGEPFRGCCCDQGECDYWSTARASA